MQNEGYEHALLSVSLMPIDSAVLPCRTEGGPSGIARHGLNVLAFNNTDCTRALMNAPAHSALPAFE